ncbi:collagen-like protein [Facklamia hominis]|uniref:collagen-like protein n=1 Tax=Facklamia hominis TaxID=178214 RepID=UPI0003537A86|nr:collagen-like protein [Facklamia hominis]EPH12530.1 hypothetical protein HMPREF9260_00645 [Facklamia hominis ACS-120-V-Sch10]
MTQEILKLENLSGEDPEAIVIRQGDTSPLKFRLIGHLEEEYQGLKFKVYINKDGEKYYQAEGTVSNKEIVEFSITEILPVGKFDLEIVVGDKRKFPSAYYSLVIYIHPSAEYSDEKIIERYGKEALIQDILPRVVKGSKGDPGPKGDPGKDGNPGKDAEPLTIDSTYVDLKGNIVIKFSDTTTLIVPKGEKGEPGQNGKPGRDGQPGKDGQDGKSITITSTTTDEQGNTLITFSDETSVTIQRGKAGKQGEDGEPGADGKDGKPIIIESQVMNEKGETVLKFSDGTSVILPKGDKGDDGKSIDVWHGTGDEFESVSKQDGTLYLVKE